ncbi:early transcribed membrane protein [Plasmodium relictum]|uniref:Early transcribed membrane protein n=1 Tax=Plasmodium relictum TaxID=85471 RepID=A0A1J1GND6_PLARL|nr:early transcribed membrane protein [Plasmodium relictum]CRG83959.1 early transcribed membrane protein [Plasmodium relictum]
MKISKIIYFLNFIIFVNLLTPCLSSYYDRHTNNEYSSLRRSIHSVPGGNCYSTDSFGRNTDEASSICSGSSEETESLSGSSTITEGEEDIPNCEKYFSHTRCNIPPNLQIFVQFITKKLQKKYNDTLPHFKHHVRNPDHLRGVIVSSASKYGIPLSEQMVHTLVKKVYIDIVTV